MTIQILGPDYYLDYYRATPSPGIQPSHRAIIKDPAGGEPFIAYVKFMLTPCGRSTPRGLLNEAIGYLLTRALGFPTPARAGIIEFNEQQLSRLTPQIRTHIDPYAWWSEDSSYPSVSMRFNIPYLLKNRFVFKEALAAARDRLISTLHQSSDIHRIMAMDDIMANIDRNPGNLLGHSPHILIDHEQILTGPCWSRHDLAPDLEYYNPLRDLLAPHSHETHFCAAVLMATETLESQMEEAVERLRQALDDLLEMDEYEKVIHFIQTRASRNNTLERLGLAL